MKSKVAMSRRKKILIVLASIAVLLVGIRAALPLLIREVANDKLSKLGAYHGRVGDIDLSLWRGAYRLEGLRLQKRGAAAETPPFFSGDRIDLSIEWRSLLKGSVVAEAVFQRPQINMIQAKTKQASQLGTEVNWVDQLKRLAPIEFNTVEVRDGTLTFRAPGIRTQDALKATRIEGLVSNLTNVVPKDKEAFADFHADAAILGDGAARVSGSVNPLAQRPTFDVNVTVKRVQLPRVNP